MKNSNSSHDIELVESNDGTRGWFLNDKLHRNDGPAVVRPDGSEAWCQYGRLHREDGPAKTSADGTQSWYRRGKLHRLDGPARLDADGTEWWYRNGKLHREDGPAVTWNDGLVGWYIDGVSLTIHEFVRHHKCSKKSSLSVRTVEGQLQWWSGGQLHRSDGPALVSEDGEEWFERGKLHRTGGPAITLRDGTRAWYRRGKLHRSDGPAVIMPNGSLHWYASGVRHRSDGPAVSNPETGLQAFFVRGKHLSAQDFARQMKRGQREETREHLPQKTTASLCGQAASFFEPKLSGLKLITTADLEYIQTIPIHKSSTTLH